MKNWKRLLSGVEKPIGGGCNAFGTEVDVSFNKTIINEIHVLNFVNINKEDYVSLLF